MVMHPRRWEGSESSCTEAHGHTAQANSFHDQLNGHQKGHTGQRTGIHVFHIQLSSCCRSALSVGYAQTCPLCAGFVVDILIVLLERVVSGRVPKRECRYRSPGKRMPADRRATVSTGSPQWRCPACGCTAPGRRFPSPGQMSRTLRPPGGASIQVVVLFLASLGWK